MMLRDIITKSFITSYIQVSDSLSTRFQNSQSGIRKRRYGAASWGQPQFLLSFSFLFTCAFALTVTELRNTIFIPRTTLLRRQPWSERNVDLCHLPSLSVTPGSPHRQLHVWGQERRVSSGSQELARPPHTVLAVFF